MAETLVLCGEAAARDDGTANVLRLRLAGKDANIRLELSDIEKRMLSDVKAQLADLIEVAAYVYCADQLVSRGGQTSRSLGKDWRRQWRFVVPVRRPALWTDEAVKAALKSTLGFMADDDFSFDFVAQAEPEPIDTYLTYGDSDSTLPSDEVALFSGGLDSLAGAAHTLRNSHSRLLLISHQSSTKIAACQRKLISELSASFPGRIVHAPVRITKTGIKAVENTQRTRSFLYAAIAATVASLVGADRLRFFENGVVSYNLPIAEQVVGARATRTTHPQVLRDLQGLVTLLLERPVAIDNPLIWHTKGEVAGLLDSAGFAHLLGESVSCSSVHTMSREKTHCGKCSQCLDRRFGVLSAGLGEFDPSGQYGVDLLTGAREAGIPRAMAEGFVRHARSLARMDDLQFMATFGGQLARTTRAFERLSADEVSRKAIDLHRRHGQAVVSVLHNGFRRHARELAAGTLPPDSILRIVGGGAPLAKEARQPVAAACPPNSSPHVRSSQIVLGLDHGRREVLIAGMEPITGAATFALLDQLAAQFEQDLKAKRTPSHCGYCGTRRLTSALSVDDTTLRRRVTRFRKRVAEAFDRRHGLSLSSEAVIESATWKGYRLNPAVRLVQADEIRPECHASRGQASRHQGRTSDSGAVAGA
ncbi:MAG: 7-cyano-7-deazaguanine synthase [Rhizobiaceae bacterium]|nr:7-cyano-7-deazaguanine synthase [Rhizobiaceae bacterium]